MEIWSDLLNLLGIQINSLKLPDVEELNNLMTYKCVTIEECSDVGTVNAVRRKYRLNTSALT